MTKGAWLLALLASMSEADLAALWEAVTSLRRRSPSDREAVITEADSLSVRRAAEHRAAAQAAEEVKP